METKTVHSAFGRNIKVEIFGGSHEACIGVTITGLPAHSPVDMHQLKKFLARRAPGNSPFTTKRKEPDIPIVKSGARIIDEILITDGSPLTMTIANTDARSTDYNQFKDIPRPGHADFTAYMKYEREKQAALKKNSANRPKPVNMSGGGPFSGRMTAPLCIAGGIALQLLAKKGISVGAHIFSVGSRYDIPFDPAAVSEKQLALLQHKAFPVISHEAESKMKAVITDAMEKRDSVGGIVELAVTGLSAGLGGSMYDGVESILSPIFFGIPAVKGLEFGTGFASTVLKGSENNDPFSIENGKVKTVTNHHGGILGGITSGMPLICRVAFKPTPSIGIEQDSVSLRKMLPEKLTIEGRHDPCIAVRAVPVCEAAAAIGLLDLLYT